MPRFTDPTIIAALSAGELWPAFFVTITFASTTAYLWSGIGSITWNGHTWTGIGSLMGLSTMEDGSTVEARGITITVSGLDPALLSDCMTEFQLGLPASVILGFYAAGALISTPIVSWSGRTDQPTIDIADQASIAINCENRLIDMNVAVDRRYTNQDQQMTWPGDLGFMFVDALQEMTFYFNGKPNNTNNI